MKFVDGKSGADASIEQDTRPGGDSKSGVGAATSGESTWLNLWGAFHRVLEAEPAEASRLLDSLEPGLRREVEELLAAHFSDGSFLLDRGQEGAEEDPLRGASIGPYRVLCLIGRGGMGSVYLAEQTEPVRRRVAIKLIREDLLAPSLAAHQRKQRLRRFEAERQALMLLNHPHVATAYEAGSESFEGREMPWVSMEWVAGLPIDQYCDRYRLSIAERLALLAQALRGVGHAHRKGIVHRDVKASNVMVTVRDGEATVKVIDFGIAKTLGPCLVTKPAQTQLGSSVGTPGTMSPEQARGEENVEASSDVYSLGLLAYRLLCGVGPDGSFESGRPAKPPAVRFAALAMAEQQRLAALRGEGVKSLVERLDQYRVVMKALAFDPAKRYRDAAAFAEALASVSSRDDTKSRPSVRGLVALTVSVVIFAFAAWMLASGGARDTAMSSRARVVGSGVDSAASASGNAPTSEPSTISADLAIPEAQASAGIPLAFTFDDLPTVPSGNLERDTAMTKKLLETLRRRGIPATGFVNSSKLDVPGEQLQRTDLLRRWLDAGHDLGNHGARHLSLHDETVRDFLRDIEEGEPVLREVLGERGQSLRWFRHPYLRTGLGRDAKETVDGWLVDHGYRVGAVTLENVDWMFASIYQKSLHASDPEQAQRVAQEYLRFSVELFDFWEGISERLFGRQHAHVLLLHANQLNADYLDSLIDLLVERNYRFVTLEAAQSDRVYDRAHFYAGPGGVLWQFRWADAMGLKIDWRNEPEPAPWIVTAFEQP